MDKKTIALAVLCIVLALSWPAIMRKLYPPPPPLPVSQAALTNQIAQTTNAVAPTNEVVPSITKPTEQIPSPAKKDKGPRPPEQVVVLENERLRIEFTSYGGGIKRIELKKYPVRQGDPSPVVLNQFGKSPMGEVTGLEGFDEETVFEMQKTDSAVAFQATNESGVRVTKEFRLGQDYLIDGEIAVVNQGKQPLRQSHFTLALGTSSAVVPTDKFEIPNFAWSDGNKTQFVDPTTFNAGWLGRTPAREVVETDNVRLSWTGTENRFFCTLWMPQTPTNQVALANVSARRAVVPQPGCDPNHPRPSDYGITGRLTSPAFILVEGESYKYPFRIYAGPKEYHRLQALGPKQTDVMQWGWFEAVAEVLLKSMNLMFRAVPNYFFVIIFITILIKLIFWPLTAMSNRSMKAMQALSPKLTALREKYKDDQQKLQAEMMKLYKEHKVNPMAGCLPTVVQIPVFIGFYYMLRTAIELRMHGFLWIHDFSQPDSIAQLGTFFINPLPIVMGATMILQMKMTPSAGDPTQQKMMMFMPLLFLFFCYGMPSGLVLYWTVQNIFTIIQMKLTRPVTPVAGGPPSAAPAKTQTQKPKVKSK